MEMNVDMQCILLDQTPYIGRIVYLLAKELFIMFDN